MSSSFRRKCFGQMTGQMLGSFNETDKKKSAAVEKGFGWVMGSRRLAWWIKNYTGRVEIEVYIEFFQFSKPWSHKCHRISCLVMFICLANITYIFFFFLNLKANRLQLTTETSQRPAKQMWEHSYSAADRTPEQSRAPGGGEQILTEVMDICGKLNWQCETFVSVFWQWK